MFEIHFPSKTTEQQVRHYLCQHHGFNWFSAINAMLRGSEYDNFHWFARIRLPKIDNGWPKREWLTN